MIKTAVFVEGQTELIFVRELLLKIFEFQNICLECFTLFTDSRFHPAEYSFPNEDASYYFQIINVGNDQSVLTRIIRREKFMWDAGFNRIIGLRDMYSKEYKETVRNHSIDLEINQKFIEGHRTQIISEKIFFSFAIMEVEAWLLGLRKCFERMDGSLTVDFINQNLEFNLATIDPETSFFHPSSQMEAIFSLIGKHYNKSKGDINAVVSYINRQDYQELLNSNACNSFKEFYSYLGIPEEA